MHKSSFGNQKGNIIDFFRQFYWLTNEFSPNAHSLQKI